MRVVREHGYSTNRTARALSGGRTGLVGVMSPVVHHSYFSVILDGAGEALYEHDMRMVLCPTHHEHEREVTLLERLMHGTTDGAVLILPEESGEELSALHEHGYRFVIIDPHKSLDERVPTVSAAHTSGASEAVEHLLGLGPPAHRRHHRAAGLDRHRGAAARLSGRAGRRRRHARSAAGGGVRLLRPRRPAGHRGPARPPRSPDRDLRLQRHAGHRRHAGGTPARDPRSRRTCR